MSGIKISKKHGVNPTIPICFWCGKEKNEVAMLGELKGDVEAPMHLVLDINPCEECQKKNQEAIDNGAVLIYEITMEPEKDFGQENGSKLRRLNEACGRHDAFFTGAMFGIKESAFNDIFRNDKTEELCDNVLASKKRMMLLPHEAFREIFKNAL